MTQDAEIEAVSRHWSAFAEETSGRKMGVHWWEAGPEIYRYRNRRVSGDPEVNWLQYTLSRYFRDKLPLARCLSLGCGNGRLERELARLGAFEQCDAYDVAKGSIQLARRRAEELGLSNISYQLADINRLILPPNSYEAVWIAQAMHHFEALEHIVLQIQHALKSGGLLILNDYVGPSRFQFPARQKEVANICLALLPARFRIRSQYAVERKFVRSGRGTRHLVRRLVDKARDGDLPGTIWRRLQWQWQKHRQPAVEKRTVTFPSARDVIATDPSEAIRSGEIIPVLQRTFEIVERKDWGGNILQFLLADIAGRFDDERDAHAHAYLKMLINIEETVLQCGEFESDFAYLVARPLGTKQGA